MHLSWHVFFGCKFFCRLRRQLWDTRLQKRYEQRQKLTSHLGLLAPTALMRPVKAASILLSDGAGWLRGKIFRIGIKFDTIMAVLV